MKCLHSNHCAKPAVGPLPACPSGLRRGISIYTTEMIKANSLIGIGLGVPGAFGSCIAPGPSPCGISLGLWSAKEFSGVVLFMVAIPLGVVPPVTDARLAFDEVRPSDNCLGKDGDRGVAIWPCG